MQRQIRGIWVSFTVSIVGLGLIVWKFAPRTASLSTKILFFVALFVFIWSAITLAFFYIKTLLTKSSALSEPSFETIFYDSLFVGLFFSVVIILISIIRKLL